MKRAISSAGRSFHRKGLLILLLLLIVAFAIQPAFAIEYDVSKPRAFMQEKASPADSDEDPLPVVRSVKPGDGNAIEIQRESILFRFFDMIRVHFLGITVTPSTSQENSNDIKSPGASAN